MSFASTINDLIGAEGERAKDLRCTGFFVHQGWRFELGKRLLEVTNTKPKDESSREWKEWEPEKDWAWVDKALNAPISTTLNLSTTPGPPPIPSITVMVIRTAKPPKAADDSDQTQSFEKVDQAAKRTAEDLTQFVSGTLKFPIAGVVSYLRDQSQYAFIPAHASASADGFDFAFFSDPSMSWTWIYNSTTRETRALLMCREYDGDEGRRQEEDRSTGCLAILKSQLEFVDQPFLPAYLCIQFMSSRMIELIASQAIPKVLDIERKTADTVWDPGSDKLLKKLKRNSVLDFRSLSEDIAILSETVTDIRFRLDNLITYSLLVRRHNNKMRKRTLKSDKEGQRRIGIFDESLQSFHEFLVVRKKKADSLAERIATQVVAVNSQRAQQMAQDSHKLAKESKRDSSSMMTIAAVTMVFLPGTWIAGIFAMPMFPFGATNQEIDPQFWWYWAVTIPLTFAVLGFWFWFVKAKYKNEKKEDILDPQLGDIVTRV